MKGDLLKYPMTLLSGGVAMLTVGLYYDVVPGRETDFEEYFKMVAAQLEKVEGYVSALLYKRVDAPNSYLIYSEWKSRESFDAFIRSREFSGAKEGGSGMLQGRPSHKIYNV